MGSLSPGAHKVLFEPSGHLWWVWSLILNTNSPLLQSCWGFSYALECGISFFGGIQHSPVYGGSATSCNFGVLTGEAECPSFYIPNAIKRGSGQKRHEIYPLITLVKWNKHMIHFILVTTFIM